MSSFDDVTFKVRVVTAEIKKKTSVSCLDFYDELLVLYDTECLEKYTIDVCYECNAYCNVE